eukprot:Seg2408.3 transcript_id=Seg2408.3/GoldUCD/mRNA.D3Y31 product="Serine/threonine-protein kinase TNNI3K" protein_id=Seg2408.3/GoldUCD/D3Y31
MLQQCKKDLCRDNVGAITLGRVLRQCYPDVYYSNTKTACGKRVNVYFRVKLRDDADIDDNADLELEIVQEPAVHQKSPKEKETGETAVESNVYCSKAANVVDAGLTFSNNEFFLRKERDDLLKKISMVTKRKMAIPNRELIDKTKISGTDLDYKEKIGDGSYGTVYKGLLKRSNRVSNAVVAIKCAKNGNRSDVTESFFRELRILFFLRQSKLENFQYLLGATYDALNTVPLTIVTVFVGYKKESLTFSRFVADETKYPLTVATFLKICLSLCEALMSLHGVGLIHNDLKVNNVLIRIEDMSAVIIDFGKATLIHEARRKSTKRDQSNFPWMSDEVAKCTSSPTIYSDVYSYGYMLNYAVSKMNRYKCDSMSQLKLIADSCQSIDPYSRPPLRRIEHEINSFPEYYLEYHK